MSGSFMAVSAVSQQFQRQFQTDSESLEKKIKKSF